MCWERPRSTWASPASMPVTYINSAAVDQGVLRASKAAWSAPPVECGGDARAGLGGAAHVSSSCPIEHLGRNTAFGKMGMPARMRWWCGIRTRIWGGLEHEERQDGARDHSLEGALLGAHARFTVQSDRKHPTGQHPGGPCHRASLKCIAGTSMQAAGRLGVDRVHHPADHRQPRGVDLGRRDRDSPGQPPRAHPGASQDRHDARLVRLPLFDHVPRVTEPSVLGARGAGRRRGVQSDRRAGRSETLDPRGTRPDALDPVDSNLSTRPDHQSPIARRRTFHGPRTSVAAVCLQRT